VPDIDEGDHQIFLKTTFCTPEGEIETKGNAASQKEISHPLSFAKMNRHEEKQIKEDDFKGGRGGDEEGGIWERGRQSHGFKQDHCEKIVYLDEKDCQGIDEEREERGNEAERDDEESHPGDKEEVGQKADERDPIKMEGHKWGCP
jgi:hypothetical protein